MDTVTLTATVAVDVTISGRRYQADAGGTVEAHPSDVGRLARFGVEVGDDLTGATMAELGELARDREIRGRSTMTREELLAALRTTDAQEG